MNDDRLRQIAARISGKFSSHSVRVGGTIEFKKDTGPLRRDIRAPGFKWSPEAFADLAKVMWAIQRSHTYSMAALRYFSKMESAKFSPDGLLGGRGYIQSIPDMRTGLGQAVEILSSFSDTLHDEISAEHWKPVEKSGVESGVLADAEQNKERPDEFVESQYDEVNGGDRGDFEEEPVSNPEPEDLNPDFDSGEPDGEEDDGSDGWDGGQHQAASRIPSRSGNDGTLKGRKKDVPPGSGSAVPTDDADQKFGKTESEMTMNTTTVDRGSYAAAFDRYVRSRTASSGVPGGLTPTTRIERVGPGNSPDWDALWPDDGADLCSGVNESRPIYEGEGSGDVSGYDNPTDGDSSVLTVGSTAGYSWLPGSRNEKSLPYYDLGLSEEDVNWMAAHSDPDPPVAKPGRKPDATMWGEEFVR